MSSNQKYVFDNRSHIFNFPHILRTFRANFSRRKKIFNYIYQIEVFFQIFFLPAGWDHRVRMDTSRAASSCFTAISCSTPSQTSRLCPSSSIVSGTFP